LIVVRAMVHRFCELMECSSDEQRHIVLAVDEACANIIKHTYGGRTDQTITIRCREAEDSLEFLLEDRGPPFDPGEACPRDLADVRPGGLGTHFMRSVMDTVEYGRREGCGNLLRMVKRLGRHAPGEGEHP
jgi:sigma-B regulation protein RsbU (phosphoserine phosphatase)